MLALVQLGEVISMETNVWCERRIEVAFSVSRLDIIYDFDC